MSAFCFVLFQGFGEKGVNPKPETLMHWGCAVWVLWLLGSQGSVSDSLRMVCTEGFSTWGGLGFRI